MKTLKEAKAYIERVEKENNELYTQNKQLEIQVKRIELKFKSYQDRVRDGYKIQFAILVVAMFVLLVGVFN